MTQAYERQLEQPKLHDLAFDDRFGLLLEAECVARKSRKLGRLVKTANLPEAASLEDLDTRPSRGLDRPMLSTLAGCGWIQRQQNLIVDNRMELRPQWSVIGGRPPFRPSSCTSSEWRACAFFLLHRIAACDAYSFSAPTAILIFAVTRSPPSMRQSKPAVPPANLAQRRRANRMTSADYRIESTQPIAGRFWPAQGERQLDVKDRALAVSLAAKSFSNGSEIRVVHVPTGEVVFRQPPHRAEWKSEE